MSRLRCQFHPGTIGSRSINALHHSELECRSGHCEGCPIANRSAKEQPLSGSLLRPCDFSRRGACPARLEHLFGSLLRHSDLCRSSLQLLLAQKKRGGRNGWMRRSVQRLCPTSRCRRMSTTMRQGLKFGRVGSDWTIGKQYLRRPAGQATYASQQTPGINKVVTINSARPPFADRPNGGVTRTNVIVPGEVIGDPSSGLPIGGLLPGIYVGVRLIADLPTVTKAGALGDAISAAKGVYDAHTVEAVIVGVREVLAAQAHAAPSVSVPATTAPRKARQRHLDPSSPRSASP